MSTPVLPYSDGLTPLGGIQSALDNIYSSVITDHATLATSPDTRYMLTGSRITFTDSSPADQTWKLYNGTANPAVPTDQVNAYNSDNTAASRYWQKTAGY